MVLAHPSGMISEREPGGAMTSSTQAVVVDTSASPNVRLRPVPATAVTLENGFWGPRVATNASLTIEHQYRQLENEGMFEKLRLAADPAFRAQREGFAGEGRLYKWLEAASVSLAIDNHAGIEGMVEEAIALLEPVQSDDGYIGLTYPSGVSDLRWSNLDFGHELFAAGHLIQAGIANRRALGNQRLFDIAVGVADHIVGRFASNGDGGRPGHPEIEMALVEMYRETRDERYLDTARLFIDRAGGRDMRVLRGHAVKATYFACGMADLYAEIGDPEYLTALESLWRSMVATNMYVTGALGGRVRSESIGREFELPHEGAYAETCAAIGSMMWNWRMLTIRPEARFGDMIELCLYNSILAGVSLEGDSFFYDNPHSRFGRNSVSPWNERDRHASRGPRARQPWFNDRVACCPPNLARVLAQLPGYMYTTSDEGLWVHLYDAGRLKCQLTSGADVSISQTTRYPWDGDVELAVSTGSNETFSLFLRIPGWCASAVVTVNGIPVDQRVAPGTYLEIRRTWGRSSTVRLHIDMRPRLLEANPMLSEARGSVALARGPLGGSP